MPIYKTTLQRNHYLSPIALLRLTIASNHKAIHLHPKRTRSAKHKSSRKKVTDITFKSSYPFHIWCMSRNKKEKRTPELSVQNERLCPKRMVSVYWRCMLVGSWGLRRHIIVRFTARFFDHNDSILLIGSFGASAVLAYGTPDAPLSQPRNLVGAHVLFAVIGVATYQLMGATPIAGAVAVSASIF